MTNLTDEQRQYLAEYRQDMNDRLHAHEQVARRVAHVLDEALAHLDERNYGLAADALRVARDGLVRDYGPVTEHEFFKDELAKIKEQR